MPIIPKFKITQDDDNVILRIQIPHVRITNMEIIADHTDFSFYCKPYLLKLKLPYDVNDDLCKAVYDPDTENGIVTITLPKIIPGLHFPNLDLLTTLLYNPPKSTISSQSKGPLIEEVSSLKMNETNEIEEDVDSDLKMSSNSFTDVKDSIRLSSRQSYGFLDRYHDVFSPLQELVSDILQVSDPDTTSPQKRRYDRLEREVVDFDPERFLGDYIGGAEDALFLEASEYLPFWNQPSTSTTSATATENATQVPNESTDEEIIDFTSEETEAMISRLRNREYSDLVPGSAKETSLLLGLSDLLFAYCYEFRISGGDLSVESASNITRLSSQLSWLDSYQPGTPLSTVIQSNLRRSFVYPYLRCWSYSQLILSDVAQLLSRGKRFVLKALLQIKLLLDRTHSYYLLSKVFIDDYCVWIQHLSDGNLGDFARTYKSCVQSITAGAPKSLNSLGLNLSRLLCWADEQLQADECPEVPAFLYPETGTAAIEALVAASQNSDVNFDSSKETSGVLGLSALLSHIKLGK